LTGADRNTARRIVRFAEEAGSDALLARGSQLQAVRQRMGRAGTMVN
jgi:hypothetical protein